MLTVRPANECRYDILSLGEIMLRLDPGEGRIRTARQFRAWEGGGEYNVARGLRRCFGQRAAVVTAFANNEVGLLMEDFILQGGVDTSLIRWVDYDGIGQKVRNGLNFTERGFGIRGAVGCSDRGHTATSQLKPEDIMDVNATAVAQAFREYAVESLIHGHTHRPGIHELTVDGRTVQRVVLGDWYEHGTVLRCNAEGCRCVPG